MAPRKVRRPLKGTECNWDWAAKQKYINSYGLPEIFTKERIQIVDFADNNPLTKANIANPLWKFSKPAGVAMGRGSMGVFLLSRLSGSCAIR